MRIGGRTFHLLSLVACLQATLLLARAEDQDAKAKDWISDIMVRENRSNFFVNGKYDPQSSMTNTRDKSSYGAPPTYHSDMQDVCDEYEKDALGKPTGACEFYRASTVTEHGKHKNDSSTLEASKWDRYDKGVQPFKNNTAPPPSQNGEIVFGDWIIRAKQPGQPIVKTRNRLNYDNIASMEFTPEARKAYEDIGEQTADSAMAETKKISNQKLPTDMVSLNDLRFQAGRQSEVLQDYLSSRIKEIRAFKTGIRFAIGEGPISNCQQYYQKAMADPDKQERTGADRNNFQLSDWDTLPGLNAPEAPADASLGKLLPERLKLCEQMDNLPVDSMMNPFPDGKDGIKDIGVDDPKKWEYREQAYLRMYKAMKNAGSVDNNADLPAEMVVTKEQLSPIVTTFQDGGAEILEQRAQMNSETLAEWNVTLQEADERMASDDIKNRTEYVYEKGSALAYKEPIGKNGRSLKDINNLTQSQIDDDLNEAAKKILKFNKPGPQNPSNLTVNPI
ncbi:MAG: hypothetical protein HY537_13290 [Deltaproteobacteria bacterium]|nr:hypothetical protein [Deltaproteobacteria bacterium]